MGSIWIYPTNIAILWDITNKHLISCTYNQEHLGKLVTTETIWVLQARDEYYGFNHGEFTMRRDRTHTTMVMTRLYLELQRDCQLLTMKLTQYNPPRDHPATLIQRHPVVQNPLQGGAPQVISWFIIRLTIVISTINHTNLAILGAPPCTTCSTSGVITWKPTARRVMEQPTQHADLGTI